MATKLWFQSALLPDGWASDVGVDISHGLISGLHPSSPSADAERHGVAIPGLSNVHSHTFQRGMAGLAERRGPEGDDFWTWREWMYRFLDRLTPDDIEAIAALAFIEMLEGGFTRVGEFHYLHHSPSGASYNDPAETSVRICAAAAETGIGLTLLPVYYAHGGFGGTPPGPGQRRFICTLGAFDRIAVAGAAAAAALDGGNAGIAPHSLRAVSPRDLAALAARSPERIHIHVAEQQKEVADCLAWSGQRPVEWLLEHCAVDERWCLIHATHMTPNELVGVAKSGAAVGLCPVTEANLGDGTFPAVEFKAAGGRFGIGTDSNVQIDAATELRSLEYSQRLSHRGRNLLGAMAMASTGESVFSSALTGGGQALGQKVGLAVGAPADIVTLDDSAVALCGHTRETYIDAMVFAGLRREIDTVWRHGRKVVSGGRHLRRGAIERRYAIALRRLVA